MDDHQALLTFKAFNILFDNESAVFSPGEELHGKIFIHPINDVQISPIKLSFKGYGTLCDPNDAQETLLETVKYWDKTVDLSISVTNLAGGQDHFIPFKETLPLNLETSIESRTLTITYSVKARFTYRSPDKNLCPLAAIRGFTIISPANLDYLDIHHFKANTYSVSKKYGFLCTAGHVNLKINVERTAYLNAENIVLEGHVENDTGRRVDNVIGVMQKVIEVLGYTSSSSKMVSSCEKPSLSTISTEIMVVKKENLAMYIDPHATTKITRNFAVPTCRPSSFDYIHIGHYSINVSYRLLIKVKQVNEICGVCIPLFIGTVPHQSCHNKRNRWMKPELGENEEERRAHYQRDLSERPCSLFESNETYLSKLNRMLHINVYPYFPYLPTSSSKQNRQFKMLASAIRAENMFMAKIKANNDAINAQKKTEQKPDPQKPPVDKDKPSFDSVQPLKPENLLVVKSKDNALAEFISKTNSIGWPKLQTTKASPNKRCSLPPVEISITDSTANLTL